MRLLAISLAASALIATSGAQTARMKVTRNGQALGTAVLTQVLRPDGGKALKVELAIKMMARSADIVETSIYDRWGQARQKELITKVNGAQVSRLLVQCDPKGASLTVEERGSSKATSRIAVPKGANTSDPSEYWFVRTRPKIGAKTKSVSFSLGRKAWSESTDIYVGEKIITLGGRKVKGHHIRSVENDSQTDLILDDRGLPLQIVDDKGLRMDRI